MRIDVETISEYAHSAMLRYATTVIEDRALPDLYDGLKPVQRRNLYGMYAMGLNSKHEPVKAARVVGNVMGLYHPHGDSSIFSGLVTLANQPTNPVRGVGNWGSMTADPGAMRYINCHLSKYADLTMFNPAYTPVMDLIPNYDEKDEEAAVLPCLLPNLLLNGAFGVAVATTCNIPSFKLDGVIKLVQLGLHSTITALDCAKNLALNLTYGGYAYLEEKEYKTEWLNFFKTGIGSICICPEHRYDAKTRTIQVFGFPPGLNLTNVMGTILDLGTVDRVYESTDVNSTDKCTVDIVLSSAAKDVLEANKTEVLELLERTSHFKTNVTVRDFVDGVLTTKFKATTVPDILNEWVIRRVALEVKALQYAIQQIKDKIERVELLIYAVDNRKVILSCLDAADVDLALSKALGVSLEVAKQILDLQIRRLSTMDKTKLVAQLKGLNSELKQHQIWLKKPKDKIFADLGSIQDQLV